jgi:hypothetical protein
MRRSTSWTRFTKVENDPHGEIGAALDRMHNQIQIVETTVGVGYKARREKDSSFSSRNLGELAVSEYAVNLRRSNRAGFIPLVLYEDPDVEELPVARLKDCHLLNTAAWLFGMYDAGLLPERLDLIDEINRNRKTSMLPVDREARTKKLRSQWRRRIKS